jgi:hypothetical protein
MSTVRSLKEAHKIAKENGLILKQVPSKLLIEWLEKSSLEDDSDTELSTMWAKLLISASVDNKSAKVSYVDLLRKLHADEAKML